MFQQLRLHQRQLAVLGARRNKTGADSVTSFWSSQSVFLIGPHTPSCHDAVISRKDPRSNVPAPATTSHQMNKYCNGSNNIL